MEKVFCLAFNNGRLCHRVLWTNKRARISSEDFLNHWQIPEAGNHCFKNWHDTDHFQAILRSTKGDGDPPGSFSEAVCTNTPFQKSSSKRNAFWGGPLSPRILIDLLNVCVRCKNKIPEKVIELAFLGRSASSYRHSSVSPTNVEKQFLWCTSSINRNGKFQAVSGGHGAMVVSRADGAPATGMELRVLTYIFCVFLHLLNYQCLSPCLSVAMSLVQSPDDWEDEWCEFAQGCICHSLSLSG